MGLWTNDKETVINNNNNGGTASTGTSKDNYDWLYTAAAVFILIIVIRFIYKSFRKQVTTIVNEQIAAQNV